MLDDIKKKTSTFRTNLEKENNIDNKALIQNIDELQSIMGDVYYTFKDRIQDRDDLKTIFSNTMASRISKNNDLIQDSIFDL